jgi:hypothetical protein
MSAQRHAISESARRPSFWPSVAEASAHIVRSPSTNEVGRARPVSLAALRFGSPDVTSSYRGGGRSQ